MNLFQVRQFFSFYPRAVTKYQLHSPFVFELACAVLEDRRWFYAFDDVEEMRARMLASDVAVEQLDYGKEPPQTRRRSVRNIARRAASSVGQGQMLFRLAQHFKPKTMLEIGTSVGVGTMYLAAGARGGQIISLEGSPELAQVAQANLDWLGLSANVTLHVGRFEETLRPALKGLQQLDFVFFDGNHHLEPTLRYFEECLPFSHEKTVFVFDDMHWSEAMQNAWTQLKNHPRVTLSLDFFELSLVFVDPDFKQKQHLEVLPSRLKPWKVF